jgi:hypothetical protein
MSSHESQYPTSLINPNSSLLITLNVHAFHSEVPNFSFQSSMFVSLPKYLNWKQQDYFTREEVSSVINKFLVESEKFDDFVPNVEVLQLKVDSRKELTDSLLDELCSMFEPERSIKSNCFKL